MTDGPISLTIHDDALPPEERRRMTDSVPSAVAGYRLYLMNGGTAKATIVQDHLQYDVSVLATWNGNGLP